MLPFICTHIHTSQQGQCNAVNIGAQVAQSDYIMVSNSDMYYAPAWNKNLKFDYPVFSPNLVEPTNNNGSAAPFLKFDGGFDA
jgi:glycosyltransferase involved in cell wall biosynthesis